MFRVIPYGDQNHRSAPHINATRLGTCMGLCGLVRTLVRPCAALCDLVRVPVPGDQTASFKLTRSSNRQVYVEHVIDKV